ncbi:MAG: M20/M25/M40 family metallo-hydrolase [Longimicrobiales bacterium]
MSDFNIPDLPSDDELGITEEDIQAWEAEQRGEDPAAAGAASGKKPGDKPKKKAPWWRRSKKEAKDPLPAEDPAPAKAPAPGPKKAARDPAPTAGAPDDLPGDSGGGAPRGPGPQRPEAPATPPPMGGMRGPVTLAVLLVCGVVSLGWFAQPGPVPANAPAEVFSSSRAMANLIEVSRAAHPPGSPEHDRVREYLIDRLRTLGLEPTVQETTSMLQSGEFLRAATVRNIVARLPGTNSTGTIVLTAHYDGRELSRGAGDDGVGVVTILEALRAIQATEPLRNDVVVLLTDAEELGLLGARAFVDQHPLMADVDLVLSVEMRGGGGPSVMFETGMEGGWAVREYAEASPRPFANSLTYEVYKQLPNDTDFTPFRQAGAQGLNFAAIGRAHVYHQEYDEPANISESTLQHHGVQLLASVRHFGGAELGVLDAPDPVYFRVPFVGLVVYPDAWVIPIGVLLLLTAAGTFLLVRRRGARIQGMLVGLGVSIVGASLAFGTGTWLFGWLRGFHPEYGALHGSSFHAEGWYVMALTAAVFFLTTTLYFVARRWYGLAELGFGAAVLPLLAALGATVAMPLGAMNLQWPVLGGLLALAVASGVPARGRLRSVPWVLAVLLALPALVLLSPLVELLWLAMNFSLAPWLAVIATVMLLTLLPALDALREPNGWWAPVLGLAAAGAFVGVGIVAAEPSADRPAPSTLAYALDRETGTATWATQPVFGDDPAADPARAWAVDRAGAPFGEARSMDAYHPFLPEMPGAPAPVRTVAPLQVSVTAVSTGGLPAPGGGLSAPDPTLAEAAADSSRAATAPAPVTGSASGARTVRVALRSGLSAEMLLVRLPAVATPRLVAVNGRPVEEAYSMATEVRAPTSIEHWGRPDSLVYLDFELAPDVRSLEMDVVEHLLRPEEVVGAGVFDRPETLAPNIRRSSDRVYVRTPVSLPLEPGATNAWAPGSPLGVGDPAVGDLAAGDTAGASDTLDAAPADSVPAPATDAVQQDTVAADTVPADTVPGDTLGAAPGASARDGASAPRR